MSMHDNITLNEFIYVYLVKIAGSTNYKQTRAWRCVCILYSMSLYIPVDEYIYPIELQSRIPHVPGAHVLLMCYC